MENYQNKLNKIGLLQNPIGIGIGFVEPPCRLIQVSLGIYRVFQTFFLAFRVPWVSPMSTGVTINH